MGCAETYGWTGMRNVLLLEDSAMAVRERANMRFNANWTDEQIDAYFDLPRKQLLEGQTDDVQEMKEEEEEGRISAGNDYFKDPNTSKSDAKEHFFGELRGPRSSNSLDVGS